MRTFRPTTSFLSPLLLASAALLAAGCGDDATDSSIGTTTTGAPQAETTTTDSKSVQVRVVPGVSIAGIAVDASRSEVEEVLGKPDSEEESRSETAPVVDTVLTYRDPKMRVILADDKAHQIESTDPAAATADGVGVGSTQAEVEAAFPEAECDTGEIVVCRSGELVGGTILTDFLLEDGKVTRVVVGRLFD